MEENDIEKEEDDYVEVDGEKDDHAAEDEVEDDDVAENEVEVDDVEDDEVKEDRSQDRDLCETAQSKCMSKFQKSHFTRKFTGKMPLPRLRPDRGHTLCASLRSRNALQHFRRATLYGNLQEKCRQWCYNFSNRQTQAGNV